MHFFEEKHAGWRRIARGADVILMAGPGGYQSLGPCATKVARAAGGLCTTVVLIEDDFDDYLQTTIPLHHMWEAVNKLTEHGYNVALLDMCDPVGPVRAHPVLVAIVPGRPEGRFLQFSGDKNALKLEPGARRIMVTQDEQWC